MALKSLQPRLVYLPIAEGFWLSIDLSGTVELCADKNLSRMWGIDAAFLKDSTTIT